MKSVVTYTERWRLRAVLLIIASAVLSGPHVVACPEETVDIGTLYAKSFQGRILFTDDGDELLPTKLEFVVTASDTDAKDVHVVPVQPNGEFLLPVRPGSYRIKIKAEGFLFTVIGTVVVGDTPAAKDRLIIHPPWCYY